MRFLIVICAVLGLAGCNASNTREGQACGPRTEADSFELKEGCALQGNMLTVVHYGLFGAQLDCDFEPTKIEFNMFSSGVNNVYPKVDLMVFLAGEKSWRTLETTTVKRQLTAVYDLPKDCKPGKYAARVKYGATDPTSNIRPDFMIKYIELK